MRIGVLALQGDFDAHRRRLEQLAAEVVLVKKPEQLDQIDGLVIPGGESGTFLKLLGEEGFAKLKQFARTRPTFGTCAGAILLAAEVENPPQAGLGAIDIRIRRNAYGRQIDSSIRQGMWMPHVSPPLRDVGASTQRSRRVSPVLRDMGTRHSGDPHDPALRESPLEMVFIRAPKIVHVGEGVEVLATEGADPVVVRQGNALAATFHPELSDDPRVHQEFLELIKNGVS